ncbi:urease accessory protein UreF [Oricola sp.]|uniref:urease accessory protein UreF n=1 Tax=Oricola sp. TaxID=1979950 RepID=UPI003BABD5A8
MATRIPATIITITATIMADTTALLRLMSWLSPVFPTGGFAYSASLEQAAATGAVASEADLEAWIAAMLRAGPLWNDAVLFAAAWRVADDTNALSGLAELGCAMALAAERRRETVDQGAAFRQAAANWVGEGALPGCDMPLCVAVGAICGRQDIALEDGLAAFLHAFVTNQLQAAIRLSLTGQNGAARLLAGLEPLIAETASRAAGSALDALGSNTIMADIAAMRHETLQPRLFLS